MDMEWRVGGLIISGGWAGGLRGGGFEVDLLDPMSLYL